jgi:hypothetical protein
MADSWRCDTYGRHFTSTENRIELARKVHNGPSHEYIPIEMMTQETYSPKI